MKFLLLFVANIGSFFQGVRVVTKVAEVVGKFTVYAGRTHYALKFIGYNSTEVFYAAASRCLVSYD